MRPSALTDVLVTYLYQNLLGTKGPVIKDVTRLGTSKMDCYVQSTPTEPLSFSLFPMSPKGELLMDDIERLVASEASFFLFINPDQNSLVAVKNTETNKRRLANGEPVDQKLKIKLVGEDSSAT